MESIRESQTAD